MNKTKKIISISLAMLLFTGALILLCCCDPYMEVCVDGVYAQLCTSDNTAIVYRFAKDESVGRYDPQVCYVPETIYYDREVYTVTALNGLFYERELVANGGHAKRIVIPASVSQIDLYSFQTNDNFDYLEEIEVHKDNEYYSSIDGVLYSKDGSLLIMYPPAKRDAVMRIGRNVTAIFENQLNYSNKFVERVSVEMGNLVFSDLDGVLYSNMGTRLEYVPYAYGSVLALPDGVQSIARWSLRYANIEHMYIPEGVNNIEYVKDVNYNPLRYVANVYFQEEEPYYAMKFSAYLMEVHCGVSREEFAELTALED